MTRFRSALDLAIEFVAMVAAFCAMFAAVYIGAAMIGAL